MNRFHQIPEYPENLTAGSVLTRLFDGLGFRFHWATEGLGEPEYKFRPREDCMSVEELIKHIWRLVNWMSTSVTDRVYNRPEEIDELLSSLEEQTFRDFNVIVVEDGSDVRCDKIVEKYHKQFSGNCGYGFGSESHHNKRRVD